MVILASDASAAEIDKQLERHDAAVSALVRRSEVAAAISTKVAERLAAARAEAAEEKRRDRYDQARERHVKATNIIKTFLDKIGQEGRDALQIYLESEAATAAANKDLPPGALRIPTIENERMGSHPPAKISERRVQWFVHNGHRVAEVGTVEAFPHQSGNGLWTIYKRSAAIQGDETLGPCVIGEYIEETVQRYEPVRLEALASSLRVPAFDAPPPGLGRPERRLMPASPVPLQVAAE